MKIQIESTNTKEVYRFTFDEEKDIYPYEAINYMQRPHENILAEITTVHGTHIEYLSAPSFDELNKYLDSEYEVEVLCKILY